MSGGIQLTAYYEAVRRWLITNISWLKSVKFYPEEKENLETPCAIVSVLGWQPDADQPGNGQLSVALHCELLVIMGMDEPTYRMDVCNAAMALSLAIENNNFGVKALPARVVSAEPDGLNPELDAYAVWSVKWVQKVKVGSDTLDFDYSRGAIRVAVNPAQPDEPDEYHAINERSN